MTADLRWMERIFGRQAAAMLRRPLALLAISLAVAAGAAVAMWAAMQAVTPAAPQMAAMVPQGALLTIEAKDFAAVLKRWDGSPEKAAWLKSDNYEVFSRSRLFGRLGDAQKEFAHAAGLPPDMGFLNEVAGRESVFAWYDIGKLEFLYITRMPAGQAERTRLVQMRGRFTARQAGGQTFYVRNGASPAIPDAGQNAAGNQDPNAGQNQGQGEDQDQNGGPGGGESRTVAFATVGDWLLLATREDLMAGALMLMSSRDAASSTQSTQSASANSLAAEPWFTDARAAAAKEAGDLRMTLNLDRIVPSPYFRSYWAQRNVTEMKQYRSAVADMYLNAADFREERVLLPKTPPEEAGGADLAPLTALLPQRAGVYRAVATPGVDAAVESLDEKLLTRGVGNYADTRFAPAADVSVQEAGSAAELETRIDAPVLAKPAQGAELAALRQALAAAGLNAMMTVSRTGAAREGVWVPFASGVALSAAREWDAPAMQAALEQAAATRLTAAGLGLQWKSVQAGGSSYFELSDTRPLEVAFRGRLCLVADNAGLMQEMLAQAGQATGDQGGGRGGGQVQNAGVGATLIAGFDLAQERTPFARWTGLVDRTNGRTAPAQDGAGQDGAGQDGAGQDGAGTDGAFGGEPGFFSQNMRSLGQAFAAIESERVVERRDGALTRQTVTYAWRR